MQKRRFAVFLLGAVLAVAGAGCGSDESPAIDAGGTTASTAPADGSTSTTGGSTGSTGSTGTTQPPQSLPLSLTGEGTATATLTYDGDQLCLDGTTDGVGAVTAAHVHAGLAGESGPAVVDLGIQTDADGPFQGCATVGAEGGVVLVDPTSYYVDLHTAAAPDGAVRAQLG